jgi:hypothetical protein
MLFANTTISLWTENLMGIKTQFQDARDFLTTELATCSRCVVLASSAYMGRKTDFGHRQMASAEDAYDTVSRLLTDPECSQHLKIRVVQDLKNKLKVLRERLDQLQRFKT